MGSGAGGGALRFQVVCGSLVQGSKNMVQWLLKLGSEDTVRQGWVLLKNPIKLKMCDMKGWGYAGGALSKAPSPSSRKYEIPNTSSLWGI